MRARLVLDVTSLLRWTGPPVGIARVEHALAMRALRREDAVLVAHDPAARGFRTLVPAWRDVVLGWCGTVEYPDGPRRGWRALVPSRKPLAARLERWRLTLASPVLAGAADLAQRGLLAIRAHGTPWRAASGERIARVPADLALGEALPLRPEDVLLVAGAGWFHLEPAALAALKRRDGFRYATLCYDLIPLTHPQYWLPEVRQDFRAYWLATLPLADLVVVNARCIAADVRRLAEENGLRPPATAVLPLGFDPPPAHGPAALPAGLAPGRYALFVSTIEPRKGHATLLRAWRALLARGLPQRHGFRLVFVGRQGWMVETVMRELAEAVRGGTVLHLSGVGGAALDALYEGAAFCLYPSTYEGFGLPVIEAFARGKAVLASTGGAVPETVGGLSPCLPPEDSAAWEAALAEWIAEPAARQPWEARIRAEFAHPDWERAAGDILDAVARLSGKGGAKA